MFDLGFIFFDFFVNGSFFWFSFEDYFNFEGLFFEMNFIF